VPVAAGAAKRGGPPGPDAQHHLLRPQVRRHRLRRHVMRWNHAPEAGVGSGQSRLPAQGVRMLVGKQWPVGVWQGCIDSNRRVAHLGVDREQIGGQNGPR